MKSDLGFFLYDRQRRVGETEEACDEGELAGDGNEGEPSFVFDVSFVGEDN